MTEDIAPCPNCLKRCMAFMMAPYETVFCVGDGKSYPDGCGYSFPISERTPIAMHNRIAAAVARAKTTEKRLDDVLKFVERWANHHAPKRRENGELVHTAEEMLSVIQHYPPILKVTRSYADGVVPDTPNPFAERDDLRAENERLRGEASVMRDLLRTSAEIVSTLADGEFESAEEQDEMNRLRSALLAAIEGAPEEPAKGE